jgi:competence protein ComEC
LKDPVLTVMGRKKGQQISFASYPTVRIMLCLILGISIASLFDLSFQTALYVYIPLSLIWITFEFLVRRKYSVLSSRISTIFYLLLIAATPALLFTIGKEKNLNYLIKGEPVNLFAWENLTIKGNVLQSGFSRSGRDVYLIEVFQTELEEGVFWDRNYKMRVYGNNEHEITSGLEIEAEIRVYEFPERRNPHEFDYGGWLHLQGVSAHGEIVSLHSVTEKHGLSWAPLRAAIQNNADQLFKGEHTALAKALLIGYKEELNPETQIQFSRSGLSHIMAVSGLHVGFIVAPFWLVIPFLWGNKWGKWLGLFLLTLLLVSYAGVTGFSPSVNRASLMAWLLTYGKLFHKVRNSINLTAVAAVILLLIDPDQLFEVGFQLSFAAVFIILLIMPEAQRVIPKKYRFGKTGGLITIILVSFVVQLGLFPILIYYFGEFSIAGPIANALVVPLLSFTVPVGLLLSVLSPIHLPLFQMGIMPVTYSLDWIHGVAESIGTMDYSYITIENSLTTLFFVWFAAIMVIATIRMPELRWKMVILLLASLNIMAIEKIIKSPANKTMEVTILDVGQGDAAHIVTPNGKHLLVDAGRWSPFANSGERVLIPYFNELGIEKLDAVFLSHPHSDHIGGMPSLIDAIEIGAIYQSDYNYDSALFLNYMQMAEEREIPIKTPKAGSVIDIDSDIRIFVLGPEDDKARPSNPNNRSLVMKIVYGNQSFLFTGDAEREQERQLVNRYGDFLHSTVYKAGHHGSNTSSTEMMMRSISPVKSVVSLAFHNPFRHPGLEAVTLLNTYSNKTKYTSISGAIVLKSDGEETKTIQWK